MYLLLIILVMISVAFITLLERKLLSATQIRLGPNSAGLWGLLQPISDAIKLFSKESPTLRTSIKTVYFMSPLLGMTMMLLLWLTLPLYGGGLFLNFSIMYFICISGMAVYPILAGSWASNCKYSMLGGLRAVAQMLAYEVSLAVSLLSLIWLTASFNLDLILTKQTMMWNMFYFMPLAIIWFASSLAETNRTPFDFAEGESELVSGFNTEFAAGSFSLIFLAEYGSILFMSALLTTLFMSAHFTASMSVKTMLVVFMFIWARASFPRYRYDTLMSLAWKSFLPSTLLLFMFYFSSST